MKKNITESTKSGNKAIFRAKIKFSTSPDINNEFEETSPEKTLIVATAPHDSNKKNAHQGFTGLSRGSDPVSLR